MRVLLIPIGSHGDVHPFVGLGVALRARGHEVILITNPHFEGLAARAGLGFAPLGNEADFLRMTANADLWKPMEGFKLVMRAMVDLVRPLYDVVAAQHRAGETVMAAQVTALGAGVAHEKLGVPYVSVHLQPSVLLSTIDVPEVQFAGLMRRLPQWLRRAMLATTVRLLVDPLMAPGINRVRRELGLAPVRNIPRWWQSPQSILGLFPEWFAAPQPDWPPIVQLTGFPLFDEGTGAPLEPALEEFLASGPAPIVFTGGSAMRHGHEFFRAAVGACERLGRRGLLLARFADQIPAPLPASVRHFSYVPFSQLLPRAAALVHHGGIGTTAQGLAAGIPQLIMPMAHDQPDNAMRLMRLGVGEAIAPKDFRAQRVSERLGGLIDDPGVVGRARALAGRLQARDALAASCEVIEAVLGRAPATTNLVQQT